MKFFVTGGAGFIGSEFVRQAVKKGQKVTTGELIGSAGSTGRSTGPHLHYEIIKNGKKVNPREYLTFK